MVKKRGKDEEVILFVLKLMGPLVLFFIVALSMDLSHMMDFAHSGAPDPLSGAVAAFGQPRY